MKWLRRPIVAAPLLGLAVWLLLASLRLAGGLQGLELRAYDRLLPQRDGAPIESRVVLIGETEPDIQRYGHPLPDAVLADALEKLLALDARVVGMDKYRSTPIAPGSERLDRLLRDHRNVVWIFFAGNRAEERVAAPQGLEEREQAGFNDLVDDPDGIVRRGLLFLDEGGRTHYSFPLRLALGYLAAEHTQIAGDEQGYLRLGGFSLVPLGPQSGGYADIDAGGYQFLLDYPGLARPLPAFTLSELLDGKVPAAAVRGKVALVGAKALSLADHCLLPMVGRRYCAEQHGYVVEQLLQTALNGRSPMRDWPESAEYAWLLLWCLGGGLASLLRGGAWRFALVAGGGVGLLLAGAALAMAAGWWIPLVPPALGWVGALAVGTAWLSSLERADRQKIRQLFERHVSAQVVAALWETREELFTEGGIKPDQLTATVLFTDLAGFTSVAEGMAPLTLMQWLNEYMDAMSAILIAEGGMINKYIGDAVMAVFGAPIKQSEDAGISADALRAAEAAVLMGERLRELNREWARRGLPSIGMRVGIYTGPLVAGTLGGRQRMEYTVIGDTVNTASRLESFDKSIGAADERFPCRILVGEATWQRIQGAYAAREVGLCHLKGKQQAIKVYQVLGRANTQKQREST